MNNYSAVLNCMCLFNTLLINESNCLIQNDLLPFPKTFILSHFCHLHSCLQDVPQWCSLLICVLVLHLPYRLFAQNADLVTMFACRLVLKHFLTMLEIVHLLDMHKVKLDHEIFVIVFSSRW